MFSPSLNNGFLFINVLILKFWLLFLNATVIVHLHMLKNFNNQNNCGLLHDI